MDSEWIKSPTARRILVHWVDSRPAWLWSRDGTTLLWRNATARYFHGRIKKHGLKLAPEAVPIKGQISRLIRLGSVGRASLSRIQFLAGEHPVSTTCSCTPLEMPDGEIALLLVGVDPIDHELLDAPQALSTDRMGETLFPPGTDYLLIDDGQVRGGSARALAAYAPSIEEGGLPALPDGGEGVVEIDGQSVAVTRFKASPQDAMLLVFSPASKPGIAEIRAEDGIGSNQSPEQPPLEEPFLPLGLPPMPPIEPEPPRSEDWVEPLPPLADRSLSSLFDRLVDDPGLYSPLTEQDEVFRGSAVDEPPTELAAPEEPAAPEPAAAEVLAPAAPYAPAPPDMIASVIEFADDPEEATEPFTGWRITGRGFMPLAAADDAPPPEDAPQLPEVTPATIDAAPDVETAERVSRYNFDELSRILTDRVSGDAGAQRQAQPAEVAPPAASPRPQAAPATASGDGIINLNAETFVLNRLPLGILVFRDQQVLFANRALTELVGYESIDSLRNAGIGAIFPAEAGGNAGPVTHVLRRDGALLPVNARLQSITWQGKPALMLSASLAETRFGHEAAVKAFSELFADAREDGYLTSDRNGVITLLSGHGRVLLGTPESDLVGKPLSILVAPVDLPALKAFLERPARFAETARPSLNVTGPGGNIDLLLFPEGQAGIVTGYFGFLRRHLAPVPAVLGSVADEVEPSMLGRLSRGVRRPLNTIIGFADLIRSAAFGPIDNIRYVEYARDIKTAGMEIATLVDELDDFARLKDGRYASNPSDVDLSALLEACMTRVRGQAATARVLVRSAISERLPRIRADGASLTQALLNLLASAIGQTPVGGSVILSAQWQDDGGIAVHVRDGALAGGDMAERFVVFRDGVGRDGEQLTPVRSGVGLALTRSLLAVNACSLSVDPTIGIGTLFSLLIPADLVVQA